MNFPLVSVVLIGVLFASVQSANEGNVLKRQRVTTSFVVRTSATDNSTVSPVSQTGTQSASLFDQLSGSSDVQSAPRINTGYASMKKSSSGTNRFMAEVIESADHTPPSTLFDKEPLRYDRPGHNQRVSFESERPQGPPVSLFETEASYVDPPGVRPSTKPATSVFNSFRPVTINREPQPPAPPDDELPQPPAAPVALIQQADGQLNQVSLTWAQLQAMLTPSTDLNGIINSITSAGSRLPAPVGPPTTFVTGSEIPGPPAPILLPAPPAPPVIPGPPAPPTVQPTRPGRPSVVINPVGALGAIGSLVTNPLGAIGSAITNPGGTLGSIFIPGSPPSTGNPPSVPYGYGPSYGTYVPSDAGLQSAQGGYYQTIQLPNNQPTFAAAPQAPAGPTIIILTGKSEQQQVASAFTSDPLPLGPPVQASSQSSSDSYGTSFSNSFSAPPADPPAALPAAPLPPSPPTVLPPAPPPLPPTPATSSYGSGSLSIPPATTHNSVARNPSASIIYGTPSAPAAPPQRLPSYVIGASPSFQSPGTSSYGTPLQDPSPPSYGSSFQDPVPSGYGSSFQSPPSFASTFQNPVQSSYGSSFQSAPQSSYGSLSSPPSFNPPAYNPPAYNPPAYNPPSFNPPAFSPPSFNPSVKSQKSKGHFKSKGKHKGKSKGSLFDKLKGNDQPLRSPSNTYGPPPEDTAADEPQGDDPLDDDFFPPQPQLSINYDYKYRGPPIMTKNSQEKGIKKLTKLLYKGIVLLGGLGALTAAPIVPAVVGGGRKRRHTPHNSTSLFDSLPVGDLSPQSIPLELKMALAHYMPPKAAITDAECLQKSFCQNLIEIDHSPYRDSLLFFYSVLSPEADSNQWLKQSLTAARKKKCQEFYCLQRIDDVDEMDDGIAGSKKRDSH